MANKDLIDKSKRELEKIINYWDMVKIENYTNNEYYWYEESHYRPILGKMILKRVFEENFDRDISLPENFGVYRKKF